MILQKIAKLDAKSHPIAESGRVRHQADEEALMTSEPNFSKNMVEQRPLILSVEDQEDNQKLINCILDMLGYSYINAADGYEALALTQRYQPTLILLDIALPDMDGLQVVRRLKQNSQTAGIPVVAVTAMAMVEERQRILAAGCDDYISKPYMFEDLEEVISRNLHRQLQRAS